jgi:hypothetical protein
MPRMSRSTLAASLALAACGASAADQTDALLRFAKANADRYVNEAKPMAGVEPGARLVLRAALSDLEVFSVGAEFDPAAGTVAVSNFASPLRSMPLTLRCEPKGTFRGMNAYGAQATVRRQVCERLLVAGSDTEAGAAIGGARAQMSPDQWRAISKSGRVSVELEVTLAAGNDPVAREYRYVEEATVRKLVETGFVDYEVPVRFEAIRLLLPGSSTPTPFWSR